MKAKIQELWVTKEKMCWGKMNISLLVKSSEYNLI
jgi:hypothetical protein